MQVVGAGLEINVYVTACCLEGEEGRVGCVIHGIDVVCVVWRCETHAHLERVIPRFVRIEICVDILQNKHDAGMKIMYI
jgi:hypothetical protein